MKRPLDFYSVLPGNADFVRLPASQLARESSRFAVTGHPIGLCPVYRRGEFILSEHGWYVEAVDSATGDHVWITCDQSELMFAVAQMERWCDQRPPAPNPYRGTGKRFQPGGDLAKLRDDEEKERGPNVEYEDQVKELVRNGALVVVSHSGGKDSQAMLYRVLRMGVPPSQIVIIHAPLKGVEWAGIPEHIHMTTPPGIPLLFAETRASATDEQRARGEFGTGEERWLLERVLERRMFPSMSKAQGRWCTSDFKIGPIKREAKEYAKRHGFTTIVDAVGLRAEETSDRAAQKSLQYNDQASTKSIDYYDWHPIKWLDEAEVFDTIREEGYRPMYVYDEGLSRCSCSFCIYLDPPDMRKAAELAPYLYAAYVALEKHIGHTVKSREEKLSPSERLELATRGDARLARAADKVMARFDEDELAAIMRKRGEGRAKALREAGVTSSQAKALVEAWGTLPRGRTVGLPLEEFTGVKADPKLVRQIMDDLEAYEEDLVDRRNRQAQILPIRVSPFRRVKYAGQELYDRLRRERGQDLYTIRCDAPCVEDNPKADDFDEDDFDDEDEDSAEWEAFGEFLRGWEDWDLEKLDEFLTLDRQREGVDYNRVTTPTGKRLRTIEWDGDLFVIEADEESDLSSAVATDWLESVASSFPGVWDYYEEPDFVGDFWSHPAPLFHGTSEEAWAEIQREGLLPMSQTRGIANRGTPAAVFTHLDPEYVMAYGDVTLRIDTAAMKADGLMPRVERETGLDEADALESLARLIGVEDYYADREHGLDPNTVVVYAPIPAKYISARWANPRYPGTRPRPMVQLQQMEYPFEWKVSDRPRTPRGLGDALSDIASSEHARSLGSQSRSLREKFQQGPLGQDPRDPWRYGGCFALAKAFHRWVGPDRAELVALDTYGYLSSNTEPHHDHVLVKVGDLYYDLYGATTRPTVLRRWRKVWEGRLYLPPRGQFLVPFETAKARGIKCPANLVRDLEHLMVRHLGLPEDWGL